MNFYPDTDRRESVARIRHAAREFAEQELRPVVMDYDETQTFPFEIVHKLGELGFMGALAPPTYGGRGLSALEFIAIVEELSRVDPSVGLIVSAHNALGVGHLLAFGTDEQKRRFLPKLCTGQALGAWCLTEPEAGSDSGGMQTRAVNDGDCWILNGSKAFITHGSVASTYTVMAVTGQENGKKRISAFIVERGMEGFTVGKPLNKLGMRSSDTAALSFTDVRVPSAQMIGNEGEGLRQAMAMLDGGRIGIAALGVGLAQGALDASIAYVKRRKQFGKTLSEFQAIQWKLAEMHTRIEAARLLTEKAALLKVKGEPYNSAASQAKYFASETAELAANEAVQMHGGNGFIKDYPVEKFYRDAKLLTIGEGTTEVQKMIIAKHLLR
ncbi:MAG TPA: acyl-CoA dehydrogenase family protein [Bacteroidota bacterium]|nr:acyl-CoA dehydrogenase family protein [Bacteroidota bacterium]